MMPCYGENLEPALSYEELFPFFDRTTFDIPDFAPICARPERGKSSVRGRASMFVKRVWHSKNVNTGILHAKKGILKLYLGISTKLLHSSVLVPLVGCIAFDRVMVLHV